MKRVKYLRKTHEGAHFHQKSRNTSCSFTENDSPTGIPQVYLELMTTIRKTLEWLLPKIPFTMKVKILFTKFAHIYR